MAKLPTALLAAAGLVGGYSAARYTRRRELGGAVLAGAGILAGRQWLRVKGPAVTGALAGTYLVGFGLSHPLAKKIGAWPSVLTVTAISAGASHVLADRSSQPAE